MLASIQKIIYPLFNTRAAGLYMILFAAVIGVATFVENDFGTSAAQKVIFQSWWFELLLLLFGICILVNVFRFRMIQQKKWAVLMLHLAIIIIIIGAGLTRYLGYEGIMHIRENDASDTFLSAETYLAFEVRKDGRTYRFDEPVLFASLGDNNFKASYLIGNDLIAVEVKSFVPNPVQQLLEDANGQPILKIVIGGASGREEYFISPGQTRRIRGQLFNFKEGFMPEAVNLAYHNDSLLIRSNQLMTQMTMATQEVDTIYPTQHYQPLKLRALYSNGSNSFVFGDFLASGKIAIESEHQKVKNESITALNLEVSVNGEVKEGYVYGKKGLKGRPNVMAFDEMSIAAAYGAKEKKLPFSIKLYDFILEKYPGTNSASSYASEVQLIDNRENIAMDYRIYMNHILDHDGYRFFQSSFDQDEAGTYLSVNHDFWGTWVSYLGYALLTLGLLLSFFGKKGRFHFIAKEIKRMRVQNSTLSVLLLLFIGAIDLSAQKNIEYEISHQIAAGHLEKFHSLLVQDHKGRMKPVHTLTREIMRKLVRKETLHGMSADQVVLGMYVNRKEWQSMPMIKLGKHEKFQDILGVSGEYASYNDFFSQETGKYKLQEETRRAYNLQPIDRAVYEKELMKVDERVNIASMVFSGRFFKLIPIAEDPNNTWVAAEGAHGHAHAQDPVAQKFFSAYLPSLQEAMQTGDYTFVDQLLDELADYQRSVGALVVPSIYKTKAEVLLNKSRVFARLGVVDFLLGMAFLIFLFVSVFKPNLSLGLVYKILFGLLILAFTFHTMGLGIRWYVSGRAPWSNGYESMIYIAWTATLAGVLFCRKSFGGLAATMVLAATVLLVAHLSYLDPEITPLVPVLKSYWLTIHVSLEAGSYGFLMLGAIIGLINLILMIFLSAKNKKRIYSMIKELSYISETTLYGGLFMVSVGTYLGGIWANESWGRYWGWDAKETWALVTILVYAFIVHMRLIPKFGGLFAYNFASLFGWASVIMTYYGVNYYLSGLHSYAAGDPIPIPQWVYIVVVALVIISALAYWRKRAVPE